MDKQTKDALTSNLQLTLTALAEILLEEGISYSEFAELARFSFVSAANTVLAGDKAVSDSRISVLTGIHRKDVKRLRSQDDRPLSSEKAKSNRAIAVVSAWTREKEYCDDKGKPLPLAYDNETPSLTTLVQSYSGDMPVRAVLEELKRMGIIEEKGGYWHLKIPAYVPDKSREALFGFLGEETSNLLNTFQHNLNNPVGSRRFQRAVSYDELRPESLELFQKMAAEKSMALLKEFDKYLSDVEKQDKSERNKDTTIPAVKAGIGIYYFEGPTSKDPSGEKS